MPPVNVWLRLWRICRCEKERKLVAGFASRHGDCLSRLPGWRVTTDGGLIEERCCSWSGSKSRVAADVSHSGSSRVVLGSASERHHHISEGSAGIHGIGFRYELTGGLSILEAKSHFARFNSPEKVEEIM